MFEVANLFVYCLKLKVTEFRCNAEGSIVNLGKALYYSNILVLCRVTAKG